MKRIRRALVLMTLALFSCTAPLYETAEVRKGLTWGGGVGGFYSHFREGYEDTGYRDHAYGLSTTGLIRLGNDMGSALGLQWSVFGLDPPYSIGPPIDFEAYLNLKVRLWKAGAGMLSWGFPRLYTITMFQDIGPSVTVRVGGSYVQSDWCGLDCALSIHRQLTERLRCHVSGCWYGYHYQGWEEEVVGSSLSAGIGLEFLPGSK